MTGQCGGRLAGGLAALAAVVYPLLGCGQTAPAAPRILSPLLTFPHRVAVPDTEVKPMVRAPDGDARLSVMLFDGDDALPPRTNGPRGVRSRLPAASSLPPAPLVFVYQAAQGPEPAGVVQACLAQACRAGQAAVGSPPPAEVRVAARGRQGPERDGVNIIAWRRFQGLTGSALAAMWVWQQGDRVVEADLVLNAEAVWSLGPGGMLSRSPQPHDLRPVVGGQIRRLLAWPAGS